jgi:hypothetical protein
MTNIDDIFNDFEYEEECVLTYKVGDYVIVRGWDYGSDGNGIEGIIVTQLINKDMTVYTSGMLRHEADFIVPFKGGHRLITKEQIIRHANMSEIILATFVVHNNHSLSESYIKEHNWDKLL